MYPRPSSASSVMRDRDVRPRIPWAHWLTSLGGWSSGSQTKTAANEIVRSVLMVTRRSEWIGRTNCAVVERGEKRVYVVRAHQDGRESRPGLKVV